MTNLSNGETRGHDASEGSSNDRLDTLRRVSPDGLEIDDVDDAGLPPLDDPLSGIPCTEPACLDDGSGADREPSRERKPGGPA